MKLTESEWTVMNAVWQGSPASVRDVLERVEGDRDWAYTTVKTMLTRLAEKGALQVHKRANTSLFEPCITQDQARKTAVKSLIDRAFDGAFGELVQHLMTKEKMSVKEQDRLDEMIRQLDQKRGKTS